MSYINMIPQVLLEEEEFREGRASEAFKGCVLGSIMHNMPSSKSASYDVRTSESFGRQMIFFKN